MEPLDQSAVDVVRLDALLQRFFHGSGRTLADARIEEGADGETSPLRVGVVVFLILTKHRRHNQCVGATDMALVVLLLASAVHNVDELIAPSEDHVELVHVHLLVLLELGANGLQLFVDDAKGLFLGVSTSLRGTTEYGPLHNDSNGCFEDSSLILSLPVIPFLCLAGAFRT